MFLVSDIRLCVRTENTWKLPFKVHFEAAVDLVFDWAVWKLLQCFLVIFLLLLSGFGGLRPGGNRCLQTRAAQRTTRTYIYTQCSLCVWAEQQLILIFSPSGSSRDPRTTGTCTDADLHENKSWPVNTLKNCVLASAMWFYPSSPGFLYI